MRLIKLFVWLFIVTFILVICTFTVISIGDRVLNVQGQGINLVQNGDFATRTFEGWQASGCFSLVLPPKESAAKAGPTQYDGECSPGESGTISQALVVSGTQYISFRYREILRGDNRLVVTFTDGNGWHWAARDTTVQNATFAHTPMVTNTEPIPLGTEIVTMTIASDYCPSLSNCRIGTKITDIEVYK